MSNSATSVRRRALVPKEVCPMAQAAEILGDKWTLLILREAFYGVQRYDDMLKDLGAPRSMLTDRLTKLVNNDLMKRRAYQEAGDRVRYGYVLTEAGKGLALTFIAMTQWGEEHLLKAKAPVHVVNRQSGAKLQVALVDGKKRPADAALAVLARRGK